MAYRRKMTRGGSKKHFRKNNKTKAINMIPRMGMRGGIRL